MTAHTDLDAREALAERLVDATTHALETLSVHLGVELGLHQALNDLGSNIGCFTRRHTAGQPLASSQPREFDADPDRGRQDHQEGVRIGWPSSQA